ncbi:hypothetical protein D3C84_715860 [compost metagenome]
MRFPARGLALLKIKLLRVLLAKIKFLPRLLLNLASMTALEVNSGCSWIRIPVMHAQSRLWRRPNSFASTSDLEIPLKDSARLTGSSSSSINRYFFLSSRSKLLKSVVFAMLRRFNGIGLGVDKKCCKYFSIHGRPFEDSNICSCSPYLIS